MSGKTSTDLKEEMAIEVPDVPTDRFGNTGLVDDDLIVSVRSKGPGKAITIHDLETKTEHGEEQSKSSSPDLFGIQKEKAVTDQSFLGGNPDQPQISEERFTSTDQIKSLQGNVIKETTDNLPLKKRNHSRQAARQPYPTQGNTHEGKVKKDLKNLGSEGSDGSIDIPTNVIELHKLLAVVLANVAKNRTNIWIEGKAYQVTEACMEPTSTEASTQLGPHHGTIDRPPPANSVSSTTLTSDVSETDHGEGPQIPNRHHQPIPDNPAAGGSGGIRYKPESQMTPKMDALSLNLNHPGNFACPTPGTSSQSMYDSQPLDLSVKHTATDPEGWRNTEGPNLLESTGRSGHEMAQVDNRFSALNLQQNRVNPNVDPERWQETGNQDFVMEMEEGDSSNPDGSYRIQAAAGQEPSSPAWHYNILAAGDQLPSNPDGSFRVQAAGGQEPSSPAWLYNILAAGDQLPSNPDGSFRIQAAGGQESSNPAGHYNIPAAGNRVPSHQAALPNFASLEVTDDNGAYRETPQERTKSSLRRYLVNRNSDN